MNLKIIAIVAILIFIVTPALGDLTDYQKGIANGLKVGLFMGELRGKALSSIDAAKDFNSFLDQFNQFLAEAFRNNQTAMDEFKLAPIPIKSSTSGVVPKPDATGRIYGYPADAYYTAIGAVPGTQPQNPHDAMGGV